MVGESGLPTGPVDKALSARPSPVIVFVVVAVLASVSGCVYFNALYNANKLFDQGVRDIEEGRESSGRMTLGASIEKAERIVASRPNSRWADDALRLIVRARVMREEWPEAADASRKLFGYARSLEDSSEAAGYLGRAELRLGNLAMADSLLTIALLAESDDQKRADLLTDRGRTRAGIGRLEAAYQDFEAVSALRPGWTPARVERVRVLIASGRSEKAAEELGLLLSLTLSDREERSVVELAEYAAASDPEIAVAGLAGVETSTLQPGNKAYLLKLRAEKEIGLGNADGGRADLYKTWAVAQDSRPAAEARATLVRMDLERASSVEEFDSLMAVMDFVVARPGGRGSSDVRELHDTMVKLDYWISGGGLGYMIAAETLRDQLQARRLARRLFLIYADEEPEALWAPKAILAALYLTSLDSESPVESDGGDPSADELRQRLLEDYGASAYVQAYFGGEGTRFTFEELEQGLRRQFERLEALADQEVRARRSGSTQDTGGGRRR